MGFNFKEMFGKEEADDYIEIDLDSAKQEEAKVKVKPFVLRNFDDVNEVLNSLRDGYTIAVIDIKPLKSKDVIELKRAVSKVKKTIDALQGSIAGFGEHTIIATPEFVDIHKTPPPAQKKEKPDFVSG